MKHLRLALWAGLLALLLAAVGPIGQVTAFPEPAVVSPSWNLDLEYDQPRAVAVNDPAGNVRWFWYLPYQVTNRTGEERLFIPEVTVYTDTGEIIRAGHGVPAGVVDAVQKQLNNPLLESPIEVVGTILQGEDYAKESVAIWPAFDGDVDQFTIFFGGISGETQTVTNPLTGEEVLVRRTKMLTYRTPGNYPSPQNQPVIFEGERDVMR